MVRHPVGIDLFAGSGGLSYGLACSGFDMRIGIEIDEYRARTLKENHENMTVFVDDIRRINPKRVIELAKVDLDELAIIVGGPPCRGFSQSNTRTRSLSNPLNSLYLEFFRFVQELQPEVFLLENVKGLKTLCHGLILKDILRLGEKLGYIMYWELIDAKDFGVPQRRKRIIFIGTRNKIENIFHEERLKEIHVRQSIDDLPDIENGNQINAMNYSRNDDLSDFQKKMRTMNGLTVSNNLVTKNGNLVLERYKHIPQGGNWKDIPRSLMKNYSCLNRCHRWIYHRLEWNNTSVPISNFRKNMLIHPGRNRGLSVREAARLQSFPDQYIFHGPLGSQQQQVANAVPPLVSEDIGRKLVAHLG